MIDDSIVSFTVAVATPMGLVVVAAINYWTSKRASRDAMAAQEAARKAAQLAAIAEERQIIVSHKTDVALVDIRDTTHLVHTIVNSQHTKLLQLVANLTARVAADNPHDEAAQEDAKTAAASVGDPLMGVQIQDTDLRKP